MTSQAPWATEAEMVADFTAWAASDGWTAYAETAGWDLLLVRNEDGFQIGVEAKLSLNAKVLCQVIEHDRWDPGCGPDVWAVLVPSVKTISGMPALAAHLGIAVITGSEPRTWSQDKRPHFAPDLPKANERFWSSRHDRWIERCPDRRCPLPDYVPDVTGGHSAPIKLTPWKVSALRAVAIMEVRGSITRADFKALKIHPSRWTQYWLKSDGAGGWIPTKGMPDFKAQHPKNYAEVLADFDRWAPPAQPSQRSLVA